MNESFTAPDVMNDSFMTSGPRAHTAAAAAGVPAPAARTRRERLSAHHPAAPTAGNLTAWRQST